jgi:glycosyltransferase involved in cell wall biosynthesis
VKTVHVVVPASIDDPSRPSGGNHYDRRVCCELAAAGWQLVEHRAAGDWPRPDPTAAAGLARRLAGIPDGAVVLLDGLIASCLPTVLVPAAARLRLVVLVHLPLGLRSNHGWRPSDPVGEAAVLGAAQAVLTTSEWSRGQLLRLYPWLRTVRVARPGVDRAEPAPGTATGTELLCVAALIPGKGHDVLLAALAQLTELPWRCSWVGSPDRDVEHAARLRRQAVSAGIVERIRFRGPLTGTELAAAYAGADLLVLPSRAETYGMVLTEALARGLPVLASAVGGVPEALGDPAAGLLVRPDDPDALAGALRDWLSDAELRDRLRQAAGRRRNTLTDWAGTANRIGRLLTELTGPAEPARVGGGGGFAEPAARRLRTPCTEGGRGR